MDFPRQQGANPYVGSHFTVMPDTQTNDAPDSERPVASMSQTTPMASTSRHLAYRPQFGHVLSKFIADKAKGEHVSWSSSPSMPSASPTATLSGNVVVDTALAQPAAAANDLALTLEMPFIPSAAGSKRKAGNLPTDPRRTSGSTFEQVKGRLLVKLKIPARVQQETIEERRARRLAVFGVAPKKPKLVGWGAGDASNELREAYFSRMKTTDKLNVLSFCDQLNPGLLVDILVSVSTHHPHLPIFDCPDWAARMEEDVIANPPVGPQPSNSSGGGGGGGNPETPVQASPRKKPAAASGLMRKVKMEPGTASPLASPVPQQHHQHHQHQQQQQQQPPQSSSSSSSSLSPPVRDNDAAAGSSVDVDDTLPSGWPRPGAGMYAQLSPADDGPDGFMYDPRDDFAFSHSLMDSHGRQVLLPTDEAGDMLAAA